MCESFKSPKQEDLILIEEYFCFLFFLIIKKNLCLCIFFFSYNVLCLYAVKLEFKNVSVDILIDDEI